MDERTIGDVSAYLDGELDPETSARVEHLVATSTEARLLYESLAAGRGLARRSAVPAPTEDEASALDAAVLSGVTPMQAAGQPAPARTSPRRRGRPPWPYFAAAAAFALVLSLGIAVLAQLVGREGTREAATAITTAADEGTATAPAPSAQVQPGAPKDALRSQGAVESDSAEARAGLAQLYLSGVQIGDAAALAALGRSSAAPTESRDEAIASLVALAEASGAGLADLPACLASTASGVPVRVDVGTFGGEPAYLVVLRSPSDAEATVAAVARESCTLLAAVPAAA